MSDTIDRQAAIDAITEADVVVFYDKDTPIADAVEIAIRCTKKSVICSVEELPSAEPLLDWQKIVLTYLLPSVRPERKKGEWIDYSDEGFVECPFCHSATNCEGNKAELHYCFSCGAELRGEQDDES